MPSIQTAWSGNRFSISDAVRVLSAYLNPNRPKGTFPWEKEGLIATPCLIGEAGVGKTSVVGQVARKFKMEFRGSQVGARAFEDVLGIPSREEDPDHPGHHKMMAPPGFPSEVPFSGPHQKLMADGVGTWEPCSAKTKDAVNFCGYGVYFHDEVGTADPDKQNQIRDMVENRRVGVLDMAEGWFQVAATNPPTKGFVTVKRMDRAVEDRLVYIPVEPRFEEVMGYWEVNGMLPDSLYKFLLDREGEGFKGTPEHPIGSRRWVLVGDLIQNLDRDNAGEDAIFETISANLTPEIAGKFKRFREFGDDQTKYPLRPSDFLNKEKSKMALDIMRKWKKDKKSALMGSSILALRAYVIAAKNEEKLNLTTDNQDTLAQLIATDVINLEHARSLMQVLSSTPFGPSVVKHMLKHNVTSDLMEKLAEASDIARGRMKKNG